MATWIIGLLLIAAIYFAARHIIRAHKNGGCVGCSSGKCSSGCGSSCSCHKQTTINFKH